ncbi:MAG TPA: Gfo/Idh/MocA family oxidoreductase [Thermomicrobiales bacterium]|nr:Gfo/Idh/MocA family oxidoreductase [Thermomicrobiales bacterium]
MVETGSGDRLRVAIVGAGGWGNQHARAFSARSDIDLCGIYSRSSDRAVERAATYKTRPYTDIDEMLRTEKPDFVSVCLPNDAHFAPTLRVIEANIPLLVEKPLVFDLLEAEQLLEEAERRGLFFAINFNHRYAGPVARARVAIEEGKLGEISFATWRFGGEGSTTHHPHANLIETQCHGIDMLEQLVGPITSVAAEMTDKFAPGYSTLAVALGFANGAVGTLLGSYDSSYAYPQTHLLEINGTLGRILVEDTVKRYTYSRTGDATREVWEAGYFDDRGRDFHQAFDNHLEALLGAFRRGDPPPVPARDGQRVLQISYRIIESFETRRIVDVPHS